MGAAVDQPPVPVPVPPPPALLRARRLRLLPQHPPARQLLEARRPLPPVVLRKLAHVRHPVVPPSRVQPERTLQGQPDESGRSHRL